VSASPVLSVTGLRVAYETRGGSVRAVEDVGFALAAGERLGLAGESGSGKTTTALALMRLVRPPGRILAGQVRVDGTDWLALDERELRARRFAQMALVPQGAMNALNPVLRVGDQLADTIRAHEPAGPRDGLATRIRALLASVGLPAEAVRGYPHELSGGMKQRVTIAMAIALRPRVLIADEPTSALDVVVQRQVMATLDAVQRGLGAGLILVGHDMGLMAQSVDRIGIMYAGRLVELGPVAGVFASPRHPYTRLLIRSVPSLEARGVLRGIPGLPPSLRTPPPGCPFHPRCPDAVARCRTEIPEPRAVGPDRVAACHLA
jgi:oligopeptide/dipeptide ABC transporter ATP-binding protein